ncbi:metalloregulator ArsR/SmtB family transcription factor [Aureibacillus halotolerans]|uniref:HTH arsR-type domain-containing protein n=1 Tax=Aureibacillus halotolerans TaxID=1508390 RepID=A0A4R6U8G3_9BACI|nr:metalloregulator ArsR/SmtB family transcription factor [Aureibacillus halotolerans]TDQ42848.1 hypothetical protein EV213_101278 [Aureibacillus halotolerans]
MQLNKLVHYYKSLSDHNRIRIVLLLSSRRPLSGKELAKELAVTPATITHHMSKLKDAGLIYERRDKNTIYYHVHTRVVEQMESALMTFVKKGREDVHTPETLKYQEKVLKNFFDGNRLKTIPSQLKKKLIVLQYIVEQLDPHTSYAETDLNKFIETFHEDFATIRREFIMHNLMYREKGIYEVNPQEMWEKWQTLS